MPEVKIEKREYFGNIYAAKSFMMELDKKGIIYWIEEDEGADKYSGISIIWEVDAP